MITLPVVPLLVDSRPADVTRSVVSVGINTIQRVLRTRLRSNVLVKRSEVVQPRGTHRDASTAVVLVAVVLLVGAAFLRLDPCGVLGTVTHAVGGSESCIAAKSHVTPTRDRVPFSQPLTPDDSFLPTVAQAHPTELSVMSPFSEAQHQQTTEALTIQRYPSMGGKHTAKVRGFMGLCQYSLWRVA